MSGLSDLVNDQAWSGGLANIHENPDQINLGRLNLRILLIRATRDLFRERRSQGLAVSQPIC